MCYVSVLVICTLMTSRLGLWCASSRLVVHESQVRQRNNIVSFHLLSGNVSQAYSCSSAAALLFRPNAFLLLAMEICMVDVMQLSYDLCH